MVARWLIKVPTVDECIIHLKPVDTPIEDFGHCYGRLYYSLLDNCAKSTPQHHVALFDIP